jgi:LemA protein
MIALIIVAVVAAVLVLLIIFVIGIYNALIRLRNQVDNAWSTRPHSQSRRNRKGLYEARAWDF